MKKLLLISLGLFSALSINSQSGVKCSGFLDSAGRRANKCTIETIGSDLNQKLVSGPIQNPVASESEQSSILMPPSTINWKLIGGTNNIYGNLESSSRPLQFNARLNAVSYVHRKSSTYQAIPMIAPTATNGVIVAEISTNLGATFDSTCIFQNATDWGSFPQGAIYNPINNTNIANAYFVGCGPTTSSVGFSGDWYASKKLNVFNANAAVDNQFIASNAVSYPSGMSAHGFSRIGFSLNKDGIAHSLAYIANNNLTGAGMRGYALINGAFNAGSFNWTMDSIIPNVVIDGAGNKHIGKAQMAWNHLGTVGYIVILGPSANATLSNRGYQPLIFKTTNSGISWIQLPEINFNSQGAVALKNCIAGVKTNSNLAIPFFHDFNLVVDVNDKLHIGATFKSSYSDHDDSLRYAQNFTTSIDPASIYSWEHSPGKRPYLVDFIGDGNSSWKYLIIDSLATQEVGVNAGKGGYSDNPWDTLIAYGGKADNLDSRIQMSRTPDGNFITFSWSETDTNFTNGSRKYNVLPNIKARCMAIGSGTNMYQVSPTEINVTRVSLGNGVNNPSVTTRATLNYMSPTTGSATIFSSSGNYTVDIYTPMTVTNSNPFTQAGNNSIWYQSGKLSYSFPFYHIDPFPVDGINEEAQNNTTNSLIFPNPTSNNTTLSIDLKNNTIIDFSVLNSIGQIVKIQKTQGQVGKNTIAIDLSGLSSGVYLAVIKVGEAISTKKIVIQ